jgi:hypothetical protein
LTTQNKKSIREVLPGAEVDRLAGLLPADALEDALAGLDAGEITGPGGLLTQLAGRVMEAALGAELSDHQGYPPGQAAPGGAGNVRNGSTPKTVATELGPVQIKTPRDRRGSFEPQLVRNRQTRLAGLDERVLDLKLFGRRNQGVYCRPLTGERVAPLQSTLRTSRVVQHGTLKRYLLIALHKLGLHSRVPLAWKIGLADDRVSSLLGLRRWGSSSAVLGTKAG